MKLLTIFLALNLFTPLAWSYHYTNELSGNITSSFIGQIDTKILGDVCILYIKVPVAHDQTQTPSYKLYGLVEDIYDCYWTRQYYGVEDDVETGATVDLDYFAPVRDPEIRMFLKSLNPEATYLYSTYE